MLYNKSWSSIGIRNREKAALEKLFLSKNVCSDPVIILKMKKKKCFLMLTGLSAVIAILNKCTVNAYIYFLVLNQEEN